MRTIAALLPLVLMPALAQASGTSGWAVNVYGLSYHPDRSEARATRTDNEVNPGLAGRYEWENGVFAEAGAYKDSGRATARFAGVGYQWRFRPLRAGGAFALFSSETYNDGRTFVAPVPVVSVELGPVLVNAVHFPKVKGLNHIAAFGFYLTVPLKAF